MEKLMGDGRWEMGEGRWERGDGRWEISRQHIACHPPPISHRFVYIVGFRTLR